MNDCHRHDGMLQRHVPFNSATLQMLMVPPEARMRHAFLTIALDKQSSQPLKRQLRRAIEQLILTGKVPPTTRVPGARTLATSLGLSRNTVVSVYDDLVSQRLLLTDGQRGTFVASSPLPVSLGDTASGSDQPNQALVRWDYGVPDPRLFDRRLLSRAFHQAMQRPAKLQLYRLDGNPSPLVTALCQMLTTTRSLPSQPEQLVLTQGSQMGIFLTLTTLFCPGDAIATEDPGYQPVWDICTSHGLRPVPIPVDEFGLDTDKFKQILHTPNHQIKAIFLTPRHQFPTTASMSIERRNQLVSLCESHDIIIIEDDYDNEFHYSRIQPTPLASVSPDRVVYIGSLSKLLFPSLRIGFVRAPATLARRLQARRAMIDVHGATSLEDAVATLIEDGELERHWRRAREIYRQRRDHLDARLRTLTAQFSEDKGFTWAVPDGGLAMCLWVRGTTPGRAAQIAARAAARGLLVRTLEACAHCSAPTEALRVGFGRLSSPELDDVFERLAAASVDTGATK